MRNIIRICLAGKYNRPKLILLGFISILAPAMFIVRSGGLGSTVGQVDRRKQLSTELTLDNDHSSQMGTEGGPTPRILRTTFRTDAVQPKLAQVNHDLKGLLYLLGSTWHTAFIKKRIEDNWDDRVEAVRGVMQEGLLRQNRTKRKVLVYPGVIQYTGFARQAFKGGPLGELVQWSDLLCGLYQLGHDIRFEWDDSKANQLLRSQITAQRSGNQSILKQGCVASEIDYIYTDLIGHKHLSQTVRSAFKYHFRILDSFGTEQAFNNPKYVEKHSLQDRSAGYGTRDLNLRQFYTLTGHTRDNSMLGFVIKLPNATTTLQRKNISLLYGKDERFNPRKEIELVTPILEKYTEVHVTLPHVPRSLKNWPVVNHGVLKSHDYFQLARSAKLVVGVGVPLEGPGILEAIANGCIFINPKYDMKFQGKPTNRTVTSQNVYTEESIGPPHVYTVDYNNKNLLEDTIRKALSKSMEVEPYIPYEMTASGFLLRLNLFLENQTLCDNTNKWPPLSMMQVYKGDPSASCDEVCNRKSLQCENSFFKHINNITAFKNLGVSCETVHYIEEIFAPAYLPFQSKCLLQKDPHLFSCASYLGPEPAIQRICPCRTYTTFKSHTCKWC